MLQHTGEEPTVADAEFLSVQTSSGIVTGSVSDAERKAVDWFDIPHAKPPVEISGGERHAH